MHCAKREQLRVRVFMPLPQVAVHALHELQEVQFAAMFNAIRNMREHYGRVNMLVEGVQRS